MADDIAQLRQKLFCGVFHAPLPAKDSSIDAIGNQLTTTLTRNESRTLWRILTGRRKLRLPRGRKCDPNVAARARAIAWLVALYEADGKPHKTAVSDVRACYDVERSQVYAALKQYPRDATGFDPTWRAKLITMYESKKFSENTWTTLL